MKKARELSLLRRSAGCFLLIWDSRILTGSKFRNFKRQKFLEYFADSIDMRMFTVSLLVWPGIIPPP